ncbi:zinc ribbon domain protein [Porphyromonadaceae bacterium COT-184 OH4590]|nr:zinc ribbon domain protein [Porphyromonadaceae bacterium COT-184 OH4590]
MESSPASQDPQEFSVEERLKALYGLQKVMSKIDEIKILRGDLPLEVQDLKDEIIGLQTRLERYSSEIKELEKSIATSKNSIEELKLKVDRKKEQQQQVVNNREYEILSKEIENIELDIQIYEKNINDANNDINHRKVDYNELTAKIEERNEDLRLKEAELDQIVVETKKEEEELRILSKELESNIDVRLLSAFKRIRKNARNGLAVVPIERNACSGCFSKIPPQRQLDIRQRRKIIVCENCGRIIVDHEMDNEHEG